MEGVKAKVRSSIDDNVISSLFKYLFLNKVHTLKKKTRLNLLSF
jgi:hypothetical protein